MKSVLSRQDEDVITEIELKIEENVTEEIVKEPSILDSSDLIRGLLLTFGLLMCYQKVE